MAMTEACLWRWKKAKKSPSGEASLLLEKVDKDFLREVYTLLLGNRTDMLVLERSWR